jgi:hypothetical protein
MAEEFLHRPDVVAVLQQMGRERMPERVNPGGLLDFRGAQRLGERRLYLPFFEVVAASRIASRVEADPPRRKHVLPGPFARSGTVFPLERVRQVDRAESRLEVAIVHATNLDEMLLQTTRQRSRQHRAAVLLPFAISHNDLVPLEVDILHPKTNRFDHAHPRAVQELRDEPLGPRHPSDDFSDFATREDDRQAFRLFRANQIMNPRDLLSEDVPIEKKDVDRVWNLAAGWVLARVRWRGKGTLNSEFRIQDSE